jgi:hypothetical protein
MTAPISSTDRLRRAALLFGAAQNADVRVHAWWQLTQAAFRYVDEARSEAPEAPVTGKHTAGPLDIHEGRTKEDNHLLWYSIVGPKGQPVADVHLAGTISADEALGNARLFRGAHGMADVLTEWVDDPLACYAAPSAPAPQDGCDCCTCDRTRRCAEALRDAGVRP